MTPKIIFFLNPEHQNIKKKKLYHLPNLSYVYKICIWTENLTVFQLEKCFCRILMVWGTKLKSTARIWQILTPFSFQSIPIPTQKSRNEDFVNVCPVCDRRFKNHDLYNVIRMFFFDFHNRGPFCWNFYFEMFKKKIRFFQQQKNS